MSTSELTARQRKQQRRFDLQRQHIEYSPGQMREGDTFEMRDRANYVAMHCGAIVRIDKDRRSVKERKRARRAARENRVQPGQ